MYLPLPFSCLSPAAVHHCLVVEYRCTPVPQCLCPRPGEFSPGFRPKIFERWAIYQTLVWSFHQIRHSSRPYSKDSETPEQTEARKKAQSEMARAALGLGKSLGEKEEEEADAKAGK